jgi:hypothetical protein
MVAAAAKAKAIVLYEDPLNPLPFFVNLMALLQVA